MKRVLFILAVVAMGATTVMAAVTPEIIATVTFGITSDFDANLGSLTWDQGNSTTVITTNIGVVSFAASDVTATFLGATDTSIAGVASATFNSGAVWGLSLYNGLDEVLRIEGITTGAYNEDETGPGVLYGGVVGEITAITLLDLSYFGGVAPVMQGDNTIGLKASTQLAGDIADYSEDWSSTNTTLTMVADESTIPEPATMLLLGLGGVLLRKRS
jgi:hypothetical protein